MKPLVAFRGAFAVLCLVTATSAAAHHSPALYDLQRTLTLVGSVVRYEWGNPHAYVHLRVESSDGDPTVWEVEAGSPTMMELRGWSADTLHVGDRISVDVSPARNPARKIGMLLSAERPDGTVLLRIGAPLSTPRPAAVAANSLAGNWLPATPEFVRFVGSLEGWPLTEPARAAFAAHTDAQNGSQNCASMGTPFLMVWTDIKQIELRDEAVVIRAALIDNVERVIHLRADARPATELSHQGYSLGRWERGALLVDTTRFMPHASGVRAGVPSSAEKRVTERFELSPDRTRLTYSYTLEDPIYLTQRIMGSVEWVHRPDLRYTGYVCDPEVARRFLAE
jgi:hypothetical protein